MGRVGYNTYALGNVSTEMYLEGFVPNLAFCYICGQFLNYKGKESKVFLIGKIYYSK